MNKTAKESHLWDRHPDDWYVEPLWCSVRLFEEEKFDGSIWDPACGLGRILQAAKQAGYGVIGTDKVKRSDDCDEEICFDDVYLPPARNIVSNPPFGIAEAFLKKALQSTDGKIAFLLPLSWMTGKARTQMIEQTPLYRIYVLGPVIEAGEKPGGGTKDFAWFVWLQGYKGDPQIKFLRRDG